MKKFFLLFALVVLGIYACSSSDSKPDDSEDQQQTDDTNNDDGSSDDGNTTVGEVINQGEIQLLAANDLGMHCADLDYQIFSILPPFNVVHAQVIEKGITPKLLDDELIKVTYEAVSNPNDPLLQTDEALSLTSTSINLGAVTKSNFWDAGTQSVPDGFASAGGPISIGGEGYAPLYPGVQVSRLLGGDDLDSLCDDSTTPAGCPSLLTAFEPLPEETGLPVPELSTLYPSDSSAANLHVAQQQMPGLLNQPQPFNAFVSEQIFFSQFDFGMRLGDRNWFAAEGVPILPIDDQGRDNAYPMMRIKAVQRSDNSPLASLDIVLPVSSEADCHQCHVEPIDCLDAALPASSQSDQCTGWAVSQTGFAVMTLDDTPPGATRRQQLLNTAKINILRLHDAQHGQSYQQWNAQGTLISTPCDAQNDPQSINCLANQTPIQCSQCHYSPALDLTHGGPVDEPQQGLKGRQQTRHKSMSNVMHAYHGKLQVTVEDTTEDMFPEMPSPVDPLRSSGTAVNAFEQSILESTCYQCHPGRNTQCLRGAMAAAGVLCQDCHGNMTEVGNDFSLRVSSNNPGDFIVDGSLRIPWADEPACQSCHTGDALNPNHPENAIVAEDGLRLLQAYSQHQLTIDSVPQAVQVAMVNRSRNSRFAENTANNANGDPVDVLYRLSTDAHGGIMCEGCHNSTHAIWPNPLTSANDNVAAIELQGHAGTLSECSSCHGDSDLGVTLDGPHGMHPVGDSRFADGKHAELVEDHKSECQACHGMQGEGTVLSRVSRDRSFYIEECEDGSLCKGTEVENFLVTLNQGQQVSCDLCHENYIVREAE